MKKKVVAFVALMLASLMIFSLGAKLARADQGIYEKSPGTMIPGHVYAFSLSASD